MDRWIRFVFFVVVMFFGGHGDGVSSERDSRASGSSDGDVRGCVRTTNSRRYTHMGL